MPVDFRQGGMISDDDLRRILVQDLPKDCRLTVILDCCHSGTALDLPYRVIASEAGLDVKKKPSHKLPRPAAGEVVLLSGCQDDQTSADAGTGLAGNKAPAGAMTTAFKAGSTNGGLCAPSRILATSARFRRTWPKLSKSRQMHEVESNDCCTCWLRRGAPTAHACLVAARSE